MTYFNTNGVSVSEHRKRTRTANGQNQIVLNFFELMPLSWAPSEIYQGLIDAKKIDARTPLTSIRRSISVLTAEGKLRKTSRKEIGMFGNLEHVWELIVNV